jgi:hypothetical protein
VKPDETNIVSSGFTIWNIRIYQGGVSGEIGEKI